MVDYVSTFSWLRCLILCSGRCILPGKKEVLHTQDTEQVHAYEIAMSIFEEENLPQKTVIIADSLGQLNSHHPCNVVINIAVITLQLQNTFTIINSQQLTNAIVN